ncbi:hypothetical protein MAE02_56260 [Microvirga aerophila]|uniref:Urease accessory protein n=2 Tax=Microvirga aerophila TaxID=670291 RepID=A0A512C144_9HYPH|nr:hypothetical protein MAE02_56260 [Microvirga aerophila]
MWAGFLRRRAILGLPLAFLSAMLVGVTLALVSVKVPAVEIGVAVSVLGLGTAITLGLRLPTAMAAIACGIFGLVHGYAHGMEMAESPSAIHFTTGFVLATALLHGGLAAAASFVRNKPFLNSLLGGGIAVAGAALLFVLSPYRSAIACDGAADGALGHSLGRIAGVLVVLGAMRRRSNSTSTLRAAAKISAARTRSLKG